MNKIRIAFLKEKTDAECRELAGHYYRRARRAEKERDQLRAECEKLRTAMIEAKSYIDHYMYGGSSYRKPAAEAVALIDAALQLCGLQAAAYGSLTPVPDELFAAEFRAWWEHHGQFCRAGGGDYERTFAFEAWRHLYPQLMSLQKLVAEQRGEV